MAPDLWQGGLNTKYHLGPKLQLANGTVKLDVRTTNQMATVYNVIGMLHGGVSTTFVICVV